MGDVSHLFPISDDDHQRDGKEKMQQLWNKNYRSVHRI